MERLYLVHTKGYTMQVVVSAKSSSEAIEKLHKWFDDTKQNGMFWDSRNLVWYAGLCDNETVIK